MMIFSNKSMMFILFFCSLSSAEAQDNCSALLQHGLSDITTRYGADHSLVTNHQRHCGSIDESTSNRTVAQAGFEIFGYFGGDGDADVQHTRRRIQNWCDENRDFAQSNSSFFEEARHINTAAVQAYEACQQFNRRDIAVTVQRDDEVARNLTITIDSTSDGRYQFLGIVNKEYSCQYFVAKDERETKSIDSTTRVDIPIRNDNIHITCSRTKPDVEDLPGGTKRLTYKHGSVQVLTSGPAMQLEFPEVVDTYVATPPGTVLPILGTECPAGWRPLTEATGRFLIGASDKYTLSSTGGRADIPNDGEHAHTGATSDQRIKHAHPDGMTRAPGEHHWIHNHTFKTSTLGSHNHGGNNMPPFLAVTYCQN